MTFTTRRQNDRQHNRTYDHDDRPSARALAYPGAYTTIGSQSVGALSSFLLISDNVKEILLRLVAVLCLLVILSLIATVFIGVAVLVLLVGLICLFFFDV